MDTQENAAQKKRSMHRSGLPGIPGSTQIKKPAKEKKKNENGGVVWLIGVAQEEVRIILATNFQITIGLLLCLLCRSGGAKGQSLTSLFCSLFSIIF
jgi:hypothetical protein